MTSARRSVLWVALAVLGLGFLVIATFDSSGPLKGDERIQHLTTIYACPQCSGQSVAESNAAVATTIRDFIRVKVASGATDREIRDDLILAYGEDVLLTPPAEGISLLIWILPVAVVVGGGAYVVLILRRRNEGIRAATTSDAALVAKAQRSHADTVAAQASAVSQTSAVVQASAVAQSVSAAATAATASAAAIATEGLEAESSESEIPGTGSASDSGGESA